MDAVVVEIVGWRTKSLTPTEMKLEKTDSTMVGI
jgi:hypothetical protein